MAEYANKTVALVEAFLALFPDAENGPAHVVVGDFNFETPFIDVAIMEVEGMLARKPGDRTLAATHDFLNLLIRIPEPERTAKLGEQYINGDGTPFTDAASLPVRALAEGGVLGVVALAGRYVSLSTSSRPTWCDTGHDLSDDELRRFGLVTFLAHDNPPGSPSINP